MSRKIIFYTSNTEPQGAEIQSAYPSSAAPPAYTAGDTARSGYTAQPSQTTQPGYTVQQPGYPPMQQPYLAQPGYPLQTFSTVSIQVSDYVIN